MKSGGYRTVSTTVVLSLSLFLLSLYLPSPVTSSFIEGLFSTNAIAVTTGHHHRARISTFLPSDPGFYNDGGVAPQPSQTDVDPMAIYGMQLEAWQGQMTALTKFMTDNPSAASSMTLPPPPEMPNLGASVVHQQQQQSTPPQQQQQQQQQKQNLPPSNFLPKPLPDKKGNKDTFDIQNTADLYLAQLKRDTIVRTEARVSGDITTANSPFSDDSVKQLGGYLSDELLELRREQLKKETQGGMDVQRIQQEIEEEETAKEVEEEARLERIRVKRSKESSTVGLSYREKLAEAKRRRMKGNDDGSGAVEDKAVPSIEVKTEVKVEVMEQVPSSTSDAAEVHPSNQMTPTTIPVVPSPIIEEKEPVPIPSTSSSDPENVQSSLRKLQGYLLKHRGGPNFGAGVLGPAEAETMKESLTELLSILRSEVGLEAKTELKAEVMEQVSSSIFDDAEAHSSNERSSTTVPVVLSPVIEEKELVPVSSTSSSDPQNIQSSLRKLQGYLLKHRGGPSFGAGVLGPAEAEILKGLSTEVLSMLRSEVGLEAAIVPELAPNSQSNIATDNNTDDDYDAENNDRPDSTPYQMIDSILASVKTSAETCRIEFSSSSDDDNVAPTTTAVMSNLLALRQNLVGAIGTIDTLTEQQFAVKIEDKVKMSTDAEIENVGKIETEVDAEAESNALAENISVNVDCESLSPSIISAVPGVENSSTNSPTICSGMAEDPHTTRLREIQATLKNMRGNQKFGLKNFGGYDDRLDRLGMGGGEIGVGDGLREISHLKDDLYEIRGILMEELDSGIPEPQFGRQEQEVTTSQATSVLSPISATVTKAQVGISAVGKGEGSSKSSAGSSTGSASNKYHEMLAKAQAAKRAKK